MVFYVSIRKINFNGKRLLSPKYMLQDGFVGIPIRWKCLGENTKIDGRSLYEIETDTKEHKEVILEGLAMWGAHLKTLETAKILLEKLVGQPIVKIVKDKIVVNIQDDLNRHY